MVALHDIMSTDVITVAPKTTLRDAMELLVARHVTGVPVVSGGEVVGIVSNSDLLALASAVPGVPQDPRVQPDGPSSVAGRSESEPAQSSTPWTR